MRETKFKRVIQWNFAKVFLQNFFVSPFYFYANDIGNFCFLSIFQKYYLVTVTFCCKYSHKPFPERQMFGLRVRHMVTTIYRQCIRATMSYCNITVRVIMCRSAYLTYINHNSEEEWSSNGALSGGKRRLDIYREVFRK